MKSKELCSICKRAIKGYGNNSQITGGRICDPCNTTYEIGFRLATRIKGGRAYLQTGISKSLGFNPAPVFLKAIEELDKLQKGTKG